ncbi:MAG: two-component system response regulator ResD [Clostridium sp.]
MLEGKFFVLVVDDDVRMCKAITDFLYVHGYASIVAANGEEAIEQFYAHNNSIDIILLDVMMPKMNGFTALEQLREFSLVPVIMLTAKSEDTDQLQGLRKGADDYIVKPFAPSVLLARIESVLRRCHQKEAQTLHFSNISISPASRLIKINDREVPFTQKEFDLLLYFCNHSNSIVSRNQILNAVWGFDYMGDIRTVDTHIKQIRVKIQDTPITIKTVHGMGYRLEVTHEKVNKT